MVTFIILLLVLVLVMVMFCYKLNTFIKETRINTTKLNHFTDSQKSIFELLNTYNSTIYSINEKVNKLSNQMYDVISDKAVTTHMHSSYNQCVNNNTEVLKIINDKLITQLESVSIADINKTVYTIYTDCKDIKQSLKKIEDYTYNTFDFLEAIYAASVHSKTKCIDREQPTKQSKSKSKTSKTSKE